MRSIAYICYVIHHLEEKSAFIQSLEGFKTLLQFELILLVTLFWTKLLTFKKLPAIKIKLNYYKGHAVPNRPLSRSDELASVLLNILWQ